MTLQTFEELEILHGVKDIKPATDNLWEIVHAVRRIESKVNELAALVAPDPAPPAAEPIAAAPEAHV